MDHRRLSLYAVLLSYGLGDVVTTWFILTTPSVPEQNPIVLYAYDAAGFGAFLVLKVLAIGLLAASIPAAARLERSGRVDRLASRNEWARYWPDALPYVPTLALGVVALLGTYATINNVLVLWF